MIDLLPSDDQQQIVDAAQTLLRERFPIDRLRDQTLDVQTVSRWNELVEFGWFQFGLSSQEELSFGIAEELLLFREAGCVLLPPSVFGTSLGVHLASEAGDRNLAERLSSGDRVGLGIAHGDGVLLLDAAETSHIMLIERAGIALFMRESFQPSLAMPALDESLSLEKGPRPACRPLASGSSALAARGRLLLSAMLAGIAEATLDLAVDYAKLREQFGRPIGAFQAIKHYCADMAVRAELAGAQLAMAGLALQEGLPDADYQLLCSARVSMEAARQNSAACIQIHGGMGFTAECHAHRYLKRSHVLVQLLGGVREIETRLVAASAPQ